MSEKKILIRVYGLLINEHQQVLISRENISGINICKFPGGGLEFGEGTADCLKREFWEEMNVQIIVKEHFYTTDFFQQSAFNAQHQIISVYYLVDFLQKNTPIIPAQHPDNHEEQFEFITIKTLSEEMLTFPIDQKVVSLLKLSANAYQH